jgi:hypothetical protein
MTPRAVCLQVRMSPTPALTRPAAPAAALETSSAPTQPSMKASPARCRSAGSLCGGQLPCMRLRASKACVPVSAAVAETFSSVFFRQQRLPHPCRALDSSIKQSHVLCAQRIE